jgi:imidazolonepropionase-like amidohydrolase
MKAFISVFILCAAVAVTAAASNAVAIRNGKIYTMAGNMIENGTVVIRDGKIEAAGKDVKIPEGARVIDATNQVVMPGFIDANCHVGLEEISLVAASVDSSESTDPVTPYLRVTDSFFPESTAIAVTRRNGITAGIVSPEDVNVFTGLSAVIEFSGKRINEAVFKDVAALNLSLGEGPKSTYGPKNKMPMTRMGIAALLRKTLQEAKEYGEKWRMFREKNTEVKSKKQKGPKKPPEKDLKLESLQDVLAGKVPIVAAAHRVDDILTAIRVLEEFGLKQSLVINHGTDAYKIADVLAREKIPVLLGPVTTQPDRIETLGAIYQTAGRLQKAGVLIAIQTNEAHNVRNLPYEAGIAVANGLQYEEALKAITINPAKIFRIDQQLGSIEVGKRANIIVASGDPLEPRTEIVHVFIGGEEIPDTSYQKEMWEELKRGPAPTDQK